MPILKQYLANVSHEDKQFVGAIAFKNEELSLPNGSKMALGIDDGHWILIYQEKPASRFKVFKYDQHEDKILVDQKPGGVTEKNYLKKHIAYFLSHAKVTDLVTLLPPQPGQIEGKK
ncbi:hypothetical protein A3H38_06000 [candidate division WOR-1 bacterium RIFCSPLOWO2_02_FULL_46_20]|uniref:Uncharacterized protein n=1 Tax=candidate division WOR-1 bacterium RIFCSPLOWO2_02_FULL_46_20 TaxID=1802567 RepID=A0A1F4RBG2_UNCSA|nr:MAG: hypothetical protein A3H38_06000 [candidate division WOR-1 bacterium RIFCSPLOWO2_02_FULL_46_20]